MSGMPSSEDPKHESRGFLGRLLMAAAQPPTPGKRQFRRTAVGVALVIVVVGGALLGYWRYQVAVADQAPGEVAAELCADLVQSRYPAAYKLLSDSLQGSLTSKQFSDAFAGLAHQLNGLQQCAPPTHGGYFVNQDAGTADIQLVMNWAAGGMGGDIHLKRQGNGWRVDSIDETLLSVGLGAMALTVDFCTALQELDFGNAYVMLNDNAQHALLGQLYSPSDPGRRREFALLQIFHYIFDGEITSCGVSSIPSGNQNTSSGVIISVGRTNLPSFYVMLSMIADRDGKSWQINSMLRSDALGRAQGGDPLGQDMGPLLIGEKFCESIDTGKDAVKAFLSTGVFAGSELNADQVAQQMYPSNRTYTGCYPDLGTYEPPSGSLAAVALNVTVNHSEALCSATVLFGKGPPNTWLIGGVDVKDCRIA